MSIKSLFSQVDERIEHLVILLDCAAISIPPFEEVDSALVDWMSDLTMYRD